MSKKESKNTVNYFFEVTREKRRSKLNQNPKLLWFTGLSGAGKSTLANALEKALFDAGFSTYTLDGDNIRKGLSRDLEFSNEERSENLRRVAEVANLMLDAGLIVCGSFISPLESDRQLVRSIVGSNNFIEIFVSTPLKECEKRDVKGFYAKARTGEIPNFTGITYPYEYPKAPDIEIDTSKKPLEDAVIHIINHITSKIR